MKHFDTGQALRQQSVAFDPAAFAVEVDRLIARCNARSGSSRGVQILAAPRATPVLILGMPRSGTTLVEQIISSHPQKPAPGDELHFWNKRASRDWHRPGADQGTDLGSARGERRFLEQCCRKTISVSCARSAPSATRVTDKMPFNFLWAGLIHRGLSARNHHPLPPQCRRHGGVDPSDSLPSLALRFRPEATELVALYFRSYQRLIASLAKPTAGGQIDRSGLRGVDPHTRARDSAHAWRPAAFAWHEACLRPESNPRAVRTPSKWQTRQPIYRNSVARWRRYEPWLGPLSRAHRRPGPSLDAKLE